ncbi:nuclear transport factor 2 family protein [Streptomyces sp. LP11]|uniref:Nuclear transport factor 2 family protein n=1 Tax=Streptomyces pyxinicus TaxID=2970331 RepID=A0ABT2BCM3_9ACTN|nr:nuclear transport factor 2 family protein [Streptomyces sp. LP11]MCS0606266.1 nuclear transport factor 2 family protein [Streptomyces sp. LP11]
MPRDHPDHAGDLRVLEQRRFDTLVRRDFGGFTALVRPELTYTHSSGTEDTLESFVGKCESGHYVYHRIDHHIETVTVVGDTAVVIGDTRADMTAGGTRIRLANRSIGVWVRADGAWRLLAHQATAKRQGAGEEGPGRL